MTRRALVIALRLTVAVPLFAGRVIHDEIMWRRISGRQPSEPGMAAWFATTLEDVARFGRK